MFVCFHVSITVAHAVFSGKPGKLDGADCVVALPDEFDEFVFSASVGSL